MQYEIELAKLNAYQKAAVLEESPACVVNANVGSGKTTVLIAKLLYLHEAKQVPYEDMIVLTFTNKAADEMKDRLLLADRTVLPEQMRWFGTFHGVCLSLLKDFLPVEQLGYTKDFVVMLPEEEVEMAEQLMTEHGLKIKYKNRLKKRLEQAMSIQDEEKKISRYQDEIFVLVDLLKKEKIAQNKMSYQDLINQTITLLPQVQNINPTWIVIDEVQDSDDRQLELIDLLKKEQTSLFAVGDPNQVIYSWRGSALNVFFTLKERYQAKELSLPINYRSSGSILEAAKYFLQNGGALEGVKETGHKIGIKNHYNPFQEADYLADRIQTLHDEGIPYSEIAIFYRLQSQSKLLENVFTKEQIPFEVSLKKSIQDIPVLNWFIKVLRYCVNPNDMSSAIAAIANKEFGIGIKEKDVKKCVQEQNHDFVTRMSQFEQAVSDGLKIADMYEYFQLDQRLKPTSATFQEEKDAILRFLSVMSESIIDANGMKTSETVDQSEIIQNNVEKSNQEKWDGKLNIQQIRDFLNKSILYGMNIFEQKIDETADLVKLMTLHASKGLEYAYVFIIGVNYGLIPMQSNGFDGDEEERRLFFVGITRAKEYLELSYYTSPDQYRVMPGPSRYLHMIPEKLVEDDTLSQPAVMDVNERLQEIKKQILASKRENGQSQSNQSQEPMKRVRHAKYGEGYVVSEDDDNIVIKFDDYGEKDFLKMFCEVEYVTIQSHAK